MPEEGKHRAQRGGPPRTVVVALVAVALVVGVVAVVWATRDHGSTTAASPASGPAPTQSGDTLPEGRTFVWVKGGNGSPDNASLRVDPARFYTGEAAVNQAKAHGDPPPENGYYIVNDDGTQLTVKVSPRVLISYVEQSDCCALKPASLKAFLASLQGHPHKGWPDMSTTPWFATVTGGKIVALDEQYLPL